MFLWEPREFLRKEKSTKQGCPFANQSLGPLLPSLAASICLTQTQSSFQRPHVVVTVVVRFSVQYDLPNTIPALPDLLTSSGRWPYTAHCGVSGPRESNHQRAVKEPPTPHPFVIFPSLFYRPLILLSGCNLVLSVQHSFFYSSPFFLMDRFICNWIFSGSYQLLKVARLVCEWVCFLTRPHFWMSYRFSSCWGCPNRNSTPWS